MKNIKLQNLRYFVAVYEEGSISAAARKVNATQSGVSVQIRDLEEQLGVSLFDRVSSGVAATRAGDRIYASAIRILREVSRLGDEAANLSGQLTGEVKIGAMPTFARAILGPVLCAYCNEYPLVDVKVTEGYSARLVDMVLSEALDFAIVPGGQIPAGLRSTFLDSDLELLATSTPIPGVHKVADLRTLPPLRLALPGPENARRGNIDQRLGRLSDAVHTIVEMDSMMTTLDLVRQSGWCSILPGCLCLPDLADDAVNFYPIVNPKMTVDYLLIAPESNSGSSAAQLLIEQLAKEIRGACEQCRAHFRKTEAL